MARPGLDRKERSRLADSLDEPKRFREGGRNGKDPRVRHDPEESAEDERGNAEGLVPVCNGPQPVAEEPVVLGVLAMRVDEDVNVEQPDDEPP